MIFIWLPYLRIAWPVLGPKFVAIGKAVVHDDSDESWATQLERERPEFLKIFREFPYSVGTEEPDPAYGTVVTSSDQEWLRERTEEIVAVLYWMCDTPRASLPAESFTYHCFGLKTDDRKANAGCSFYTKYALNIESVESLRVLPPLATRGYSAPVRLRTDDLDVLMLSQILDATPRDRLVIAVRNYLRTHFTDAILGSKESDTAATCAVVEAACGIDATSDGMKKFQGALTDRYGKGDGRERFFAGMYIERSLYVHGVNFSPELNPPQDRFADHDFFNSVRWRGPLQRGIARDAITVGLHERTNDADQSPGLEALHLLDIAMGSTGIWQRAKRVLTARQAAQQLLRMDENEFNGVRNLCNKLMRDFSWSCVREQVNECVVAKAIVSCVLFVRNSPDATDKTKSLADALGKAADALDRELLKNWSWSSEFGWCIGEDAVWSRVWHIKQIAAVLAAWFEPDRGRGRERHGY